MNIDDVKEIRMYYPMTLNEVFALLPEYSEESTAKAYKTWAPEFYRKVGVFTNVRRVLYERFRWENFCKENDYPANDYLIQTRQEQNEWELFYDITGMGRYLKQVRDFQQALSAMRHGIDRVIDESLDEKRDLDAFRAETVDITNFEIITKKEFSAPYYLDEMWFNGHINNTPHKTKELRNMPYEEYLKTPHWRGVRDAMIMLYGCRCQGHDCDMMGDSGYGGAESMIHVHHLTYENRGNERYKDLTLLCDRCHRQAHGIAS